MGKEQVTVTIEKGVMEEIRQINKKTYPGLSFSAVLEILLREGLSYRRKDIAVA